MLTKISEHWMIICITLVSCCLYFLKLGSYPIHLTPDEAALGYNAYSLLHTARDEHGAFLPIVFQSFGDYKPGLYVYLAIPSVALFGLTEFATRLPGAFFGVLAVICTYLIFTHVAPRQQFKVAGITFHSGHLAAFLITITPWHFTFSRGAWESGVALTLNLCIIYTFLLSLSKKSTKLLLLTASLSALTLWTYHGAKLSTALLLLSLSIAYIPNLRQTFSLKTIFTAITLALIIAYPIWIGIFTGQGGRFSVYSVFSYTRTPEEIQQTILEPTGLQRSDAAYSIYFGEPLEFTRSILRRYFNHFNPNFLFFSGDPEHAQLTVPYTGVFYWWEAISIVLGVIYITKHNNRFKTFLIIWALLAPIPSALSRDEVNAVRSLPMLIPLIYIGAIGWYSLFKQLKSSRYLPATLVVFIGLYCISLTYMFEHYFNTAKYTTADLQSYGYKQVVLATQPDRDLGTPLVMSQSYDQPYIYFLFYDRYDPRTYQQTNNFIPNESGDVGTITQINDNIQFRAINWTVDQRQVNTIFVGDPITTIHTEASSNPEHFKATNIDYPNGNERFRIVKVINQPNP